MINITEQAFNSSTMYYTTGNFFYGILFITHNNQIIKKKTKLNSI